MPSPLSGLRCSFSDPQREPQREPLRGPFCSPKLRPAALYLALVACIGVANADLHGTTSGTTSNTISAPSPHASHLGHHRAPPALAATPTPAPTTTPTPKASVPLAKSWTEANDTVGQFLRGHIDLLRWEMNNAPPSDTANKAKEQAAAKDTLSLQQAIQLSLRDQPQWLQRLSMSAAEQSALNGQLQAQVLRVQRAWIEAVSARQSLAHSRHNLHAVEAGAELAERMAHIGNWSRARQMQEELLLWEARSQLQSAELKALQTHLALWQSVGQAGTMDLPALPDLPKLPDTRLPSAEQLTTQALAANLKWAGLQTDAERQLMGQTATSLAQARQAMRPDSVKPHGSGMGADPTALVTLMAPLPPVTLPSNVPWSHSTENALQAQAQADAMQRQIRADVRLAHAAYLHAHTQATQNLAQVLRLHTALEQESLLRYNGMLKSTWDLLASARQRIQSTAAVHQAQTQAWLAWTDLQAVLNGLPYTGQLNLDGGNASSSKPSPGH